MKLNKIFYALLASVGVFAGCQEKVDFGPANISLSPSSCEFAHEGESKTISVKASRDWKVDQSTLPEWVTISPMSGPASASASEVTITLDNNPLFDREAKIKFTAEDKKAELSLVQKGSAQIISISDFVGKPNYDSSKPEWHFISGEIISISDPSIGKFIISDEIGTTYIEVKEMTKELQQTNDGSFASIGLKVGDVVTLSGVKGEKFQMGGVGLPVAYYVSHETPKVPLATRISVDETFGTKLKSVAVKGRVVAVSTSGFVINGGGSKNLLVSGSNLPSVAKDDVVEVQGKVTRSPQVAGDGVKLVYLSGDDRYTLNVTKITDAIDANLGQPKELDGAAINSFVSDHSAKVKVKAQVQMAGQTRYLVFDGTTVRGVAAPSDLDNKLVSGVALEITGYFIGSGNGRELHLIPVEVKESLVPYFRVSTSMLTFAADDEGEGSSQSFTVESNIGYDQWTVTSSAPEELKVEQNAMAIKVIPTKNTTTAERTYTVTVSYGGVSAVVDVVQSAPASDKDLEILMDIAGSSSVADGFPTTGSSEAKTFDILNQSDSDTGIYKWTFTPQDGTYFHNKRFKVLQIGKMGANISLPAVPGKKLTQVTLLSGGRNTCEAAAIYMSDGLGIVTGGDAPADGMGKNKETVWNLGGTQSNTSYQLRVCSDANLQIQKLILIYR